MDVMHDMIAVAYLRVGSCGGVLVDERGVSGRGHASGK